MGEQIRHADVVAGVADKKEVRQQSRTEVWLWCFSVFDILNALERCDVVCLLDPRVLLAGAREVRRACLLQDMWAVRCFSSCH